jgi:uncharacterized HAD superfamily protein
METCTGLSREQLISIFRTPEFFKTLPLISSTKEWLQDVSRSEREIVLMTDRFWYQGIEDDTRTWLSERQIPFKQLEFATKFQKVVRSVDLGIRFFVEDQLSNANMLADVCERVFLVNRTYNQGKLSPNVTRILDCLECSDLIDFCE